MISETINEIVIEITSVILMYNKTFLVEVVISWLNLSHV